MEIKEQILNGIRVAEILSNEIIICNTEDALDLIGNIYYRGFDKMIIYEKNITPYLFDLKTKLAGDIVQKFVQYKMALIIIGDFSKYKSKSLKDFIYESNKGNHINFLSSTKQILKDSLDR